MNSNKNKLNSKIIYNFNPHSKRTLNCKIPKVGSANIGYEFILKIFCKVVHSLLIYNGTDTHTHKHAHIHIAVFLIVGVTYHLIPCFAFYSRPIYLQS